MSWCPKIDKYQVCEQQPYAAGQLAFLHASPLIGGNCQVDCCQLFTAAHYCFGETKHLNTRWLGPSVVGAGNTANKFDYQI